MPTKPKAFSHVRLFYGTTRALTKERFKFYSDKEKADLSYGIAYISIPPNHKPGQLEEKHVLNFWSRPNPLTEVVLDDARNFPKSIFLKRLQDSVRNSRGKRVLFFVHGFNNTFSESARRAGQFAFDLGITETPVMYSWPSRGTAAAYAADAQAVAFEGQQLAKFIADVVVASKATEFSVVAHSMGNLLLALSLNSLPSELRERKYPLDEDRLPFKEIVMAAPDVEQSNFKAYVAPKLAKSGARVSIYHSYADLPLLFSTIFHWGAEPVGRIGPGILAQERFDAINATRQSIEGLGLYHSYFASWPVIRDLRQIFAGKAPKARNYLCNRCGDDSRTWTLIKKKICATSDDCR